MENSKKGEKIKLRFDFNNFWPVYTIVVLNSLKIIDGLQYIFYSLNSGNQTKFIPFDLIFTYLAIFLWSDRVTSSNKAPATFFCFMGRSLKSVKWS